MAPQLADFFVTSNTDLMSRAIQWGTSSRVNHAGVYVGAPLGGIPQVVEARPGGAGYAPLSQYTGSNTKWSSLSLTDEQRSGICSAANALIGTPYGWLDIFAISLAQKRLGSYLDGTAPLDKQPWWYRRIARIDRLICSELVDYAYFLAGVHLFDDGRPFGLVSPGDLEHIVDGHE